MAEKISKLFGEMAENVALGLGPGRGSVIAALLKIMDEGVEDVHESVHNIARIMEASEPTRADKEIILDATKAEDWRKLGIVPDKAEEFARLIRTTRHVVEAPETGFTSGAGWGNEKRPKVGRRVGWGGPRGGSEPCSS